MMFHHDCETPKDGDPMASLAIKSSEVLSMVGEKSTNIAHLANPEDDGYPRMVTLHRQGKELVAVGAADGDDAARQVAILVLKMEGGLRIGDTIQITRI
jgi:hypothetical protein